MTTLTETGVDGFLAGLRRCGLTPEIVSGVVTFMVRPLAGSRAGQEVSTGVGVEELGQWPFTPPHWVHLPEEIQFTRTNTQASPIAGWLKHSRQIGGWGDAAEPAQAWISHVRAVVGEAI